MVIASPYPIVCADAGSVVEAIIEARATHQKRAAVKELAVHMKAFRLTLASSVMKRSRGGLFDGTAPVLVAALASPLVSGEFPVA